MLISVRQLPRVVVTVDRRGPVMAMHWLENRTFRQSNVVGESLRDIVDWAEGIIEQCEKLRPTGTSVPF